MINIYNLIKEDWQAHGRDWTLPGFRAVAICRLGQWSMAIEPKLVRAPFRVMYRALHTRARNVYGIELPYTVKLGRRVVFEHQGGVVIHGNCEIGDGCHIRQGVTLGNRHLDAPFEAPKLGSNVNVGAGAKVLGGITVGDNASIGANAVVLSDVPAGDTVVGIPAKSINKHGLAPRRIDAQEPIADTLLADTH